jgi:hypothetical protein
MIRRYDSCLASNNNPFIERLVQLSIWDFKISEPYSSYHYDDCHVDDLGGFGKHLSSDD